MLTVEGDRTMELVLDEDFPEGRPAVSPDGRWIAYQSGESGQGEIYVRPFPNVDDGKWQVSTDNGFTPVWSPDGRELFFLSQTELMVVRVETEPTFNATTPESVLSRSTFITSSGRAFDVAPDGERFLFLRTGGGQVALGAAGLVFVQNWFEELQARVPTGRYPTMPQDDRIFQLIFILGIAIVVPIGIYQRLRSQASREKLDRRQEGLFILLTLRPIGWAGLLGVLTFVVNPARMAWSSVPLPVSLRWAGVGVGLVAAALLVWTFRSLGTNITDTVVTRREHTLVTTGPYHFVRHPFYVAAALAMTAFSLVMANWFLALTGVLGMSLLVMRTRTEEEHLIRRFGEKYSAYMETTGRFLPRFAHKRS